jgi:hypothetical protein
VAPITQFVDVDLLSVTYNTGPADASGVVSITSDQVPPGTFWRIERIVVSNTSTDPTTFRLYKAGILEDGSYSGNFDVADGGSPLRVDSALHVLGQWTGCSLGAVGTITLEGMVVQRIQVGTSRLGG